MFEHFKYSDGKELNCPADVSQQHHITPVALIKSKRQNKPLSSKLIYMKLIKEMKRNAYYK